MNGTTSEREDVLYKRMHKIAVSKSPEEMVNLYDSWGQDYDKDTGDGYSGPSSCVNALLKYMNGDPSCISVVDIGAGTGLSGAELQKHGFKNIDAVEPSEVMLQEAEKKKVYKNIHRVMFTDDVSSIGTDKYDVAMACGCMGVGHVPASAISEMIRIVKPGGLISMAGGLNPNSKGGVEKIQEVRDEIKKLEEKGLCTCLEDSVIPSFAFKYPGQQFVLKVNGVN